MQPELYKVRLLTIPKKLQANSLHILGTAPLGALFSHLDLWIETHPRSAAANMAVDETLLRALLPRPLLRFYRWRAPALSFGYFQRWSEVQSFLPAGVESIRRWTGGGLVDHREDVTYSLIVPSSSSLAQVSPRDSYGEIHARLAAAVRAFGEDCHLAPEMAEPPSAAGRCFAGGHARHDILRNGRKIAGAAQRRHRLGLLHQGSLAFTGLPESFPQRFAAILATETANFTFSEDLEARAAALIAARYETGGWRYLR